MCMGVSGLYMCLSVLAAESVTWCGWNAHTPPALSVQEFCYIPRAQNHMCMHVHVYICTHTKTISVLASVVWTGGFSVTGSGSIPFIAPT